ncbi:MAG TPA: enoyl-CoA hydratase/isomerase family protein [Chloroflexota bacterium]|nr:enoyl-CoA hydratase/isomerase family protein [Chloroflexota bacterium]
MNAVAPLQVAERDRVVYVQVTHPSPAGASASRAAEHLLDLCSEIRQRLDVPNALVLVSKGDSFCTQPPTSAADCEQSGEVWRETIQAVAELNVPTVAGLAGNAIGTAWELAMACDLRLAEAQVSLGSPESRLGCMPSCGGTQRLARLVGPALALQMLLLGEIVDSGTALERGLIHRVVQTGGIDAGLELLLEPLRHAAPLAQGYAKEAVYQAQDLSLSDGLRLEADLATLLQTTRDRTEGIKAFLERRTPRYEGR